MLEKYKKCICSHTLIKLLQTWQKIIVIKYEVYWSIRYPNRFKYNHKNQDLIQRDGTRKFTK